MRWRSSSVVALAVLLVFGCRTAPIVEIRDSPIPTPCEGDVTLQTVERSIVWAALSLGWKANAVEPGLIVGQLDVRQHRAVVEIAFSTTSYSILYESSVNLNEHDALIHKNYNRWIRKLDRAIKAQLSVHRSDSAASGGCP